MDLESKDAMEWTMEKSILVPERETCCYPKGEPKARWITNDQDFEKFLRRLKTCEEFALDTEYHNF